MGDFNARVAPTIFSKNGVMGPYSYENTNNDNGSRMLDFCSAHGLFFSSSKFPHKRIHQYTYTSPGNRYRSQIDHVLIDRKWLKLIGDIRNKRGADVSSDHLPVLGKLCLTFNFPKNIKRLKREKFD